MEEFSELKSARLLSIYARLLNGQVLKKALLAQEFGVTARSTSAIWNRCARSSPTKCCRRTWSMTARRAATG